MRSHIEIIRDAQNGLCAICGGALKEHERYHERWGWSIEHVYPKMWRRYEDVGNKLVTHRRCNQKKGGCHPEPALLRILEAVNDKLGWKLTERPKRLPPATTYDWDRPTLRIAFEEGRARAAA